MAINEERRVRTQGTGLFGASSSGGGGGGTAPLGILMEASTGGLDFVLQENDNEIYLEMQ